MEKKAVVFGAGKIARGFLAHLLTLSGYRILFVEKNRELVEQLAERKWYRVRVMGAPEKDIIIEGFGVASTEEPEIAASGMAAAAVVFVSVGGPNLPGVAPILAAGITSAAAAHRQEPLNVILCENYFEPAAWLRSLVAERLAPEAAEWMRRNVGIVETMVLRSVVEPDTAMKAEDPLSLSAQDMWELPADAEALVGTLDDIRGFAPKPGFRGSLVRKLFTYNATNAVISYPGYQKGYLWLSDAANDRELAALARAAMDESGPALCARYGFDSAGQRQLGEAALAKYQNRAIVDPIERNTRDPIRKLARHDRLVGPAALAMEHGTRPVALVRAIAAALQYDYAGDPSAALLQALIAQRGIAAAVEQVCGIDPSSTLGAMVIDAYRESGECRQ